MGAAITVSNTFDFNTDGWYYPFETGAGSSNTGETNFIAVNYSTNASVWAYSAQAIYGKDVSSVILKITTSSNRYSNKDLSFCFACAPLANRNDSTDSSYSREEKSIFGARTSTFILPAGASQSIEIDITNVVQHAAQNYNCDWGLYVIGGEFDGKYNDGGVGYVGPNGVAILDPEIITLEIDVAKVKIHNGNTWTDGVPYIHNGTTWVKAKAIYIHNGSTWEKV